MKFRNIALRVALSAVAATALIGVGIMPATSYAGDQKSVAPHTAGHTPTVHASMKAKMSGPFDGKLFDGTCGLEGKTDGSKEEVSFRGGMFKSSYCLSQGFKAAPYTTENKDGVTTFRSEQTDPAKGTLVWEGTISGDNLIANGTLTSTGKDPAKFWIKAALKPNQHASHPMTGKK